MAPQPPKPDHRPDRISFWRHLRLFRHDILSAQPARLYRAWMAEFRTPFFKSYLCNDPDLIDLILKERPDDFPKSDRIREGLAPLLGRSVFLTNGETWKRQRRIIDPAFEGGRLRDTFPAMWAACDAAIARMPTGEVEVEEHTSHAAADVIFRTLFSLPIEDKIATEVFHEFRRYQRSQPLLNLAAFLRLPKWLPRPHRRETRRSARQIRALITQMTQARSAEIANGAAPDDLATKIMTTQDPKTGARFDTAEMVDQVAIFFLAGHETSAAALAWALYMLAQHPEAQARVAEEAARLPQEADFSAMSGLGFTRDVFRETLRLYPPVPMMVRQNRCPEEMRGRPVAPGGQIVISPWHVHRHSRMWEQPDLFRPERWQDATCKEAIRRAYLPFSSGPRVCTGAGFAMIEGPLLLARLIGAYHFDLIEDLPPPVPVAHLTLRAQSGIHLRISPRAQKT